MLKRMISKLLEARQPWRYIGFDELSELYTSTMLRSMGLSVIGIFVPIYLYKLEYSIPIVCLFMALVCATRIISDALAGYVTAAIGPKHTILLSNMGQIVSLALFLMLSQHLFPLWLVAIIWGISLSLFFVPYHVDFSKIMHQDHGGKELGYMTTLERIGAAIGPFVGGLIASLAGAEYTIMVAMVLIMGATIPLFLSAEPTRTHQHIHFRGLPYRKIARDGVSHFGLGLDNSLSVTIWPLFIAVTIFVEGTYASVGLVTSLGIISAVVAAQVIGKVIDRHQARRLYVWSSWLNVGLHPIRPFVGGFGGVVATNVANEVLTTSVRLPYYKAMYARAEELPGFRIAYIVYMEVFLSAGKAGAWFAVWVACLWMQPRDAMTTTFIAVGLVTLLLLAQRFPVLAAKRFSRA